MVRARNASERIVSEVVAKWIVRRQLGENQLGIAENARQRVVHLVRDAGRELADGSRARGLDEVPLVPVAAFELMAKLADEPVVLDLERGRHGERPGPLAEQERLAQHEHRAAEGDRQVDQSFD